MTTQSPTLTELIDRVKSHPRIADAGMILCHNGFVRASDRSGRRRVTGLTVETDTRVVEEIRDWALGRPGIIAVEIHAFEGDFSIGDDLLYVVVAGDIRENVFSAMREIIERMKSQGVRKTETYE